MSEKDYTDLHVETAHWLTSESSRWLRIFQTAESEEIRMKAQQKMEELVARISSEMHLLRKLIKE